MSHDERWMMEAIREAQAALREDEVPVGAVVVKDDKIVARAHNLSQQKGDPTQHAELWPCSRHKRQWAPSTAVPCM